MSEINVIQNDFRDQTFLELTDLSKCTISNSVLTQNSAYFIGTVVSIKGVDSVVEITNSNFYNNNGMTGGLFYVYRESSLKVYT